MQASQLSDLELDELWREFHNPPAEYRGTPFWAWNCDMTEEKAERVLMDFQKIVRFAHEKANELGLKICLYDEDRWPSGYGGGLVTKNEAYRSRFLLLSPKELAPDELWEEPVHRASAQRKQGQKKTGQTCMFI